MDKYPIDNGHSLIITKKPYEKITDMDVDEVAKLFSKIPKIANAIIKATNADAFSIAQKQWQSCQTDYTTCSHTHNSKIQYDRNIMDEEKDYER